VRKTGDGGGGKLWETIKRGKVVVRAGEKGAHMELALLVGKKGKAQGREGAVSGGMAGNEKKDVTMTYKKEKGKRTAAEGRKKKKKRDASDSYKFQQRTGDRISEKTGIFSFLGKGKERGCESRLQGGENVAGPQGKKNRSVPNANPLRRRASISSPQ